MGTFVSVTKRVDLIVKSLDQTPKRQRWKVFEADEKDWDREMK
jgi:hypothetical protein